MILSFHPYIVADLQIILGARDIGPSDMDAIREAKAIVLPQTCPKGLWEACIKNNNALFPNYSLRYRYQGKIGQAVLFRKLGVPHPLTACWRSVTEYEKHIRDSGRLPHQYPFYLKADRGHEGSGIFFVSDDHSHMEALKRLKGFETTGQYGFVSQEAIDTGGRILRAVVVGGRIITYWKVAGDEGQRVITISKGAHIDKEWGKELQETARRQTLRLLDKTGINLAAIDMIFPAKDPFPSPLFLEINYYFGRRGLGGSDAFYNILLGEVRHWIARLGLDASRVRLA